MDHHLTAEVGVQRASAGGSACLRLPPPACLPAVCTRSLHQYPPRIRAGAKRVRAPPTPPQAPPPTSPLALSRRELEGGLARGARWRGFSYCRLLREWDPFVQEEEGLNQAWWPPFHLRRRQPILEGALTGGGLRDGSSPHLPALSCHLLFAG